MVTTDMLDRMEHVGETVIAEEVVDPGQTASAHDASVGSTNAEVQPQSGDYSEGFLQGYPTDTNPAQPAPLLPLLHVAFPAMTNQNLQNPPEVVGYSEGLHQAYTTTLTLAQPAPALPHHHHDPPEPTLSPRNIQVQAEDVEYWKSLPQVYPCNNVQVQQSDGYWDGALRPPVPYTLTIPSTYHGLQCQDGAMLQSQVLSAGYAYDGQHWSCTWPTDAAWLKPAPPEYMCDDRLLLTLIDGTERSLPYVGVIEENHGQQLKDDLTYIKKPPNAFMLFLEEQRPHVAPELKRQGTSKVNKALGRKWKSLTVQEKAKYFQQARIKAFLHKQLYPGWNNSKNYGKRRKRKRSRDCEKNDTLTALTPAAENIPQAMAAEGSDLLDSLVCTTLLDQHYAQDDVTPTGLVRSTHAQNAVIAVGVGDEQHAPHPSIQIGATQLQLAHNTAIQAALAELEDQQVALTETRAVYQRHLQDAAIEQCLVQDTLEQDTKTLLPFLSCETFDLSTDIDNLDFWPDGFLANGLQDSHC
ncbi:uncharacterized protein LOC142877466 isoform X2 [Nelusetta ayraudi]|uniref:uncharacterized protein LOC142877466 isoform X2 n=1 Tax=Nelusetta ayraudi TaxID=303726 RepID=UPI003F6F884B